MIITVVNLDFRSDQEGLVMLSPDFGLPPAFDVVDLLDATSYAWRDGRELRAP